MAADLFETYVVTLGVTMVSIALTVTGGDSDMLLKLMTLPLIIGGVCIVTSVIGTYMVRLGKGSIMGALYKGFWTSAVLGAILAYPVTQYVLGDMNAVLATIPGVDNAEIPLTGMKLFYCMLIGLGLTGLLVWITEYYTGTNYRPVQSIAKASQTGHGTNVIQGLAISLESTALPTLVIVIAVIAAYQLAGVIGVAFGATSMLAMAGMVVALDAYGPVTDNAGGIAEMAGLEEDVRARTDALDAVGNTTKAVTKGYAIGSAALAALVLFGAYTDRPSPILPERDGRFLALQPLRHRRPAARRVAALQLRRLWHDRGRPRRRRGRRGCPRAVPRQSGDHGRHRPAQLWPDRRPRHQGRDPRDDRALAASGAGADRRLFLITLVAGQASGFAALGALLLGVIVSGLFVAISMTSGGGAWDNAKKYIEDGNYGGKGSEAHKAAVTGDTVGDPYKDTAGPAVNPMIKITNIVALLLLAALAGGAH